jgi:SpoVK/Ycf46/Vps4 family AAA+-type ATPase
MILGVQGSGKTHIAKALAKEIGSGAIKLDMGRVFAGLVGESEKRMRMALAQAEAAGGVIIIDEIDKGLAGAGSSDKTDGGTTKRVIGTLLTWMQEPHPGLFIVATANDITAIRNAHPELLRKGRFDEIWFADIPNEKEREDIFKIHLEKRGRKTDKIDLKELAAIKYVEENGKEYVYTGAEIEYAIKEAISHKLAKNIIENKKKIGLNGVNDIKTADIKEQLLKIKPIVKVGEKAVKVMRDWAKDNARNVSTIPVVINKNNNTGKVRSVNTKSLNLR